MRTDGKLIYFLAATTPPCAYRTHLQSRGLAPASINQRLSAIRKLAKEATYAGLLESSAQSDATLPPKYANVANLLLARAKG
jgi:hypothetical protein